MMYIYALVNIEGHIKYIGKTNSPRTREEKHRREKLYWETFKILVIVEDGEIDYYEKIAIGAYHRLHPTHLENKYLIPWTPYNRPEHSYTGKVRPMNSIKAIETKYGGYRMRSRTEAKWAVFFDACEIGWDYELQGFEMRTPIGKIRYLPDFWLTCGQWAEVKGFLDEAGMRRLCAIAETMTVCGKGNDLAVFPRVPRAHSLLWPVQLHMHGKLWAVPWLPEPGCPLARPRVAVAPTAEMAEHLVNGFPFGVPDWAVDGLEHARDARFEWGEHG